ncbi:MAG TPA: hypothetical protein VFJ43_14130, partial [Bacteroidia bacterium]|nr:hypothetical protein [Bacteroidia bacterium]
GKLNYLNNVENSLVKSYIIGLVYNELNELSGEDFLSMMKFQSDEDFSFIINSLQKLSLLNIVTDKIEPDHYAQYGDVIGRINTVRGIGFNPDEKTFDIIKILKTLRDLDDADFVFAVMSLERLSMMDAITSRITIDHFTEYWEVIDRLNAARGNTDILNRFNTLMAGGGNSDGAREILITLHGLPSNRKKILVFEMLKNGNYSKWMALLKPDDKTALAQTFAEIENIEKEYKNPLFNIGKASHDQKKKISEILTPGVSFETDFVNDLNGRTYEMDIIEKLGKITDQFYNESIATIGSGMKYDWTIFDRIADEAKKSTDALYGEYRTGPAFTPFGKSANLKDQSEKYVGPEGVADLVYYLIVTQDEIDPRYGTKNIHQAHNAIPTRDEEATIINKVMNDWINRPGNVTRLTTIEQTWPGEESENEVRLVRYKKKTNREEREFFWGTFQTLIHEYLHSITSNRFERIANRLGGTKRDILIEGGTSYFTEQVWTSIYPEEIRANDNLRTTIEGKKYPYDPTVIPELNSYTQMDQLKEIVAEIGEENMRAAYFRGKRKAAGI